MSSISTLALMLAATLMLSACAEPGHYPISGEECSAEDPAKDLDASMTDCAPNI